MSVQLQAIHDIAALFYHQGIREVVMCPGSRCAPLTLSFTRHPGFTVRTFSDERSAAFIALGIAQQLNQPVVLLCTSGTAAYNFSPAVAEAYFNHVPLVVLTADRPFEWIDQQDGQAIFQHNIFGRHAKQSFSLPQEYSHADDQWVINRIANDAINLSRQSPKGPVHINAPFREPFYPENDESIRFSENIRKIDAITPEHSLKEIDKREIQNEWSRHHRIMILAGQADQSDDLISLINKFSENNPIPLVGDIICNLHGCDSLIRHADVFLGQASDEVKKSLRPDLLVTFGKSVLSKQTKQFLRKYKPNAHWHIQIAGNVPDTFQSLTKTISTSPEEFFNCINALEYKETFERQKQHNYYKLWEIEERRTLRSLDLFFPQEEFGEFELVKDALAALPANVHLHLANSMSVRYANFIGLTAAHHTVKTYSNRGTSGIDGCTSTMIGHAFANGDMHVLITGDLAFFYDRNAFWHNYALPNVRIIVLNNHGGAIFKMIDGPADLPEADEFFVTKQTLTAKHICDEFGFEYIKLSNRRQIKNALKNFFEEGNCPKILELETTALLSKNIFENFKNYIRKSYDV